MYPTEVHLETQNGNDTATDQKQLFVLYWGGQNIYMLESMVVSLQTEQRGEKTVAASADFGFIS